MGFGKFLLRYFEIMARGGGMVPLLGHEETAGLQ